MHRTLSACCWNSRCDNNTLSQKNWGTHVMPHNSCKCGPILIILSLPYTQINCRKRLTLVPATRGVGKNTPQCSFCKKSPSKQWNKTVIFCDIVTDPFGFSKQLGVSLYLLPILRGRPGSSVHETGFCDYQQ